MQSSLSIKAAKVTIEEEKSGELRCDGGQSIYIEDAEWTYDMFKWRNLLFQPNYRNLLYIPGKAIGLCTYDVTENVKRRCHAKDKCEMKATRAFLNDKCNYWMELNVKYTCVDCAEARRKRELEEENLKVVDDEMRGSKSVENFSRSKRPKTQFLTTIAAVHYFCNLSKRLSRTPGCPHDDFVTKHIDSQNPNSVDGAVMFAIQSQFTRTSSGSRETPFNSVFIGNTGFFVDSTDPNMCVFLSPLPKYNCQPTNDPGGWTCTYCTEVIATHRISDGHYMHDQDYPLGSVLC